MTDETKNSDNLEEQTAAEGDDAPDVMPSYDYDFGDEEDDVAEAHDDASDAPAADDDEPSASFDAPDPDENQPQGESGAAPSRGPLITRGRLIAVGAPLAFVILLLGGNIGYQAVATNMDDKAYPAPGRLVDVGGHRLHIHCQGQSEDLPTVLFEAAPGGWSVVWRQVQQQVAKLTRACAYDRAGYGWSEAGPGPRDGRRIVNELQTLLTEAKIPGPYVLVGHDMAGLWLRRFARRHADQVAGLVLVNTVEEDALPLYETLRAQQDEALSGLALYARFGLLRHVFKDRWPNPGLTGEAAAVYDAWMMRPATYQTIAAETSRLREDAEAARTMGTFGKLPLAVVTTTTPARVPGDLPPDAMSVSAFNAAWKEAQARLTRLAINPVRVFSQKSGHQIPVDDPRAVALAVQRILERIAGKSFDAEETEKVAQRDD